MLRSLAAEIEGPLTIRDVENAPDYPDHTTFERRFGSWNKAKQAAGLKPIGKGKAGRSPTYSDEELLDKLRLLDYETDGRLTKAVVNNAEDCPSESTYRRRFGSWSKAKEEAGIYARD